MEQGWVKLYRKINENDFLMTDNTAYIVFTKLLTFVNKQSGTYRTGRFALSERTNIKPNTLYKALIRLEENRLVTLASNNKYTDISICNWGQYQAASNIESNNTVTTGEQQSNNKVTLNKNKKENKKEKISSKELTLPVTYGKPEINEAFQYWQEQVGYPISAKIQANRFACSNLIKKHGMPTVYALIRTVAASQADQFSGVGVSDFSELQTNLNKLLAWGRKQGTISTTGRGIRL